jgi:hypothetical protein
MELPMVTVDTNVPPVRQFETYSPPSHVRYNNHPVSQQVGIALPRKDITPSPLRSNTVACHPASLRPGTTHLSHSTPTPPYPVTRSVRPSPSRASTLSPAHAMNLQRNVSLLSLGQNASPSPQPIFRTASDGANPMISHPPLPTLNTNLVSTGGRPTMGMRRMSYEDSEFNGRGMGDKVDIMGVRDPVQVYDPVAKRTIYHG